MIENRTISETQQLAQVLSRGGIVLYPTDTIWGLGCDALNEKATDRIYSLKQRPRDKPLILLVSSIAMLKKYVPRVHPRLETLLSFHKRPLTVIYPDPVLLPDFAKGPDGSIAMRVTCDPFCRDLIEHLGGPLVSTSANFSDAPAPEHFGGISSDLLRKVDYVAHHRRDQTTVGAPSAIVKLSEKAELIFLRT